MPDDLGGAEPGDQPIAPGTGALIGAGRAEGPALETPDYAGFWNRFAAAIIDALITATGTALLLGPFYAVLFFSLMDDRGEFDLQAFLPVAQPVGNLVSLIAGWLYAALMESSRFQGTLGKMAVQIKVTDLEGNRISFGRATGRHFGKIVSTITLFVGFIMVAFTEKKQGLHDVMAGCLVVRK